MFAPLYGTYVQNINSAIYHVGSIWSFHILSVGILTLFISKYENHKEYADYFLILGFICRAIGWLGYIFATSVIHLYLIQLVMALGELFGTPSFNLIYSSFLTKGKFASEWGINKSLNSFLMAGASFLGGIIWIQHFILYNDGIIFCKYSIALKFRTYFIDEV